MLVGIVLVLGLTWITEGLPQDVVQFPQEKDSVQIGNRIPGSCTAVNGENCIFPFKFKGETYNKCTYAGDSVNAWCALERSANQDVVVNRWGDCVLSEGNCPLENNINNIVNKNKHDCFTIGGPDANKKCIFPFIHGSIQYHDCTRAGHANKQLWCSTKVDSDGRHIAGQDFFGTCNGLCFSNNNRNVWNNWGSWGTCSAFCGGSSTGVQERTRACSGTNCVGENKESKSCYNVIKCGNGDRCQIGSTWKQDCNTCICTSEGRATCTTLQCSGMVTSRPCTGGGNTGGGGGSDPQCSGPAPTSNPCTNDRGNGGGDTDPHCGGGTRNPKCVTSSGPSSNQPCAFPFNYVGRTFTTCDVWRWGGRDQGKFWCSTKTDANGNHINGQGNYGFCPESQTCRGDDIGVFNRIFTEEEPEAQVAPA